MRYITAESMCCGNRCCNSTNARSVSEGLMAIGLVEKLKRGCA
jgi:hypothetical protein